MSKPRLQKETCKALGNLGFRIGDCALKLNLIRSSIQGAHETIFEALDAPDSRLGDKNYANSAWGAACSLMALGDVMRLEIIQLSELMDDLQSLCQSKNMDERLRHFEQKYSTLRDENR